jgi:hypothetical protein
MALPHTSLAGLPGETRTGLVPESTIRRVDETPVPFDVPVASSEPLEALAARLEVAVTASAGSQSALSDLLVTAKFLTSAISEVCDTNSELLRELSALGMAIGVHAKERAMLESRIDRLNGIITQSLEEASREHSRLLVDHETTIAQAREEAARERAHLVAEHDGFIAMLVADHEREILALRRDSAERAAPPVEHAAPVEQAAPVERAAPVEIPELPRPNMARPRLEVPELPRPPFLPRPTRR